MSLPEWSFDVMYSYTVQQRLDQLGLMELERWAEIARKEEQQIFWKLGDFLEFHRDTPHQVLRSNCDCTLCILGRYTCKWDARADYLEEQVQKRRRNGLQSSHLFKKVKLEPLDSQAEASCGNDQQEQEPGAKLEPLQEPSNKRCRLAAAQEAEDRSDRCKLTDEELEALIR